MYTKDGHMVLEFARPDEAIEVQRDDGPIDVLVVNVNLPNGSGTQIALELKAILPNLKVLFASGTDRAGCLI
jgi:DNA-binding NarL/FixJ family response regulator